MTKVNHDLRSNNGVTIWLPPEPQTEATISLDTPSIRSSGTAQLFPIGTKMTTDERVFRYCLADTAAIVRADYGAGNNNKHMEGDAIGNAVADAYTLNWRISDKEFTDVIYTAVNVYEGGYFWIMNADVSLWEFHKIVSNLVATGITTPASHYVTLTFADPITTASTTPWCTAYRNIYSDVRNEYPDYPSWEAAVVCVPHIKAAVDEYFWGQTWGPMWTTAVGAAPKSHYRTLIFSQGGTIARYPGDFAPATYGFQPAGYILTDTTNTGDMMYMLTLAP